MIPYLFFSIRWGVQLLGFTDPQEEFIPLHCNFDEFYLLWVTINIGIYFFSFPGPLDTVPGRETKCS